MLALVTGGVGYLGARVCEELREAGWTVRALDVLLHGQEEVARLLEERGVELVRADIRDMHARDRALEGCAAVVHLAAIVGDPACARFPDESHQVNVVASRDLLRAARTAGVGRFVFASTCSNYGRVSEPDHLIDEDGDLAPVSRYAEQKVEIERMLLDDEHGGLTATALRFATIYGVAPRMRFDLTVNEFTRDLWAGRRLVIYGERFWRPYVHVGDAARAVRMVLEHPIGVVGGRVYNVGSSDENYRKLDLVREIRRQVSRGSVTFEPRDEDPRDYRVSFDRIRLEVGFTTHRTVPEGIGDVLEALEAGAFPDPYDPKFRNLG